jgi:hypothetical protein
MFKKKGELEQSKLIEVNQKLFPNGNAEKFYQHMFRTMDTGF